MDDFTKLNDDFKREAEFSRISRKASDNLQEEYCRMVQSVATEKQRNLMFIEKAKREFINEMDLMGRKVAEIDSIKARVS